MSNITNWFIFQEEIHFRYLLITLLSFPDCKWEDGLISTPLLIGRSELAKNIWIFKPKIKRSIKKINRYLIQPKDQLYNKKDIKPFKVIMSVDIRQLILKIKLVRNFHLSIKLDNINEAVLRAIILPCL